MVTTENGLLARFLAWLAPPLPEPTPLVNGEWQDGYWNPSDGPLTPAEAVRMLGGGAERVPSTAKITRARNKAIAELIERLASGS